jgi:FHA domain
VRVEITIDGESSRVYPLTRATTFIGSSGFCEIPIPLEGISRRHVCLEKDGDKFFITDQGSANGSYIDDARLTPGRKFELPADLPVRLGTKVLLVLIDEGKVQADIPAYDPEPILRIDESEGTKIISLRDLENSKTSDLLNRKIELKSNRPISKRRPEGFTFKSAPFVLFLLLLGFGLIYFLQHHEAPIPKAALETLVPLKKIEVMNVVPNSEATPTPELIRLLGEIKCAIDVEIFLCNALFKEPAAYPYGVVQLGTTLNALLEGDEYLALAKKLLPPESPDYDTNLVRMMAAVFFLQRLPNWDYLLVQDMKLIFALWVNNDALEKRAPMTVFAIHPKDLIHLKQILSLEMLSSLKDSKTDALKFMDKYVLFY